MPTTISWIRDDVIIVYPALRSLLANFTH